MTAFVERTGISLNITDVGWAPLATITWGRHTRFIFTNYGDRQYCHVSNEKPTH